MYLTRGSIPVCLFSLSTLLTLLYYSAKCLRSSNAHPRQSWSSEHTSLKPFTYPVPETRFLHAGVNVYKFKIKYGNTTCINTDLQEGVVNEELQVNRGSKLRETVDTERAIKWGRWEDAEEISHTRVHVDRNVAKSATHDTSKSNYNRCSSARVGSDYDNRSVLGESMKTKNTENRHPEGQPPALEKRSEESMALKKKGFLESLKSTLFPPVLQQIFSGNGQPS
ncbi:membrane-anchored junction protein isoform X9 [Varanus komodoensis]|uniref:membrane-anchored junction protein isoform X9 n=1 Tax=Varanus komodoensis TaxID=61221 RepID=UPI001CF7B036|nr:membrane-anchored junction protein isoform X9 [Varanus komodoensis]